MYVRTSIVCGTPAEPAIVVSLPSSPLACEPNYHKVALQNRGKIACTIPPTLSVPLAATPALALSENTIKWRNTCVMAHRNCRARTERSWQPQSSHRSHLETVQVDIISGRSVRGDPPYSSPGLRSFWGASRVRWSTVHLESSAFCNLPSPAAVYYRK